MREFNLLIKKHIDHRLFQKTIGLCALALLASCILFHVMTDRWINYSLQKKEKAIDQLQHQLQKKTNHLAIKIADGASRDKQHFDSAAWLKKRDGAFKLLFKLQMEPLNHFCLTSIQFKKNQLIMQGNSISAAMLTELLLNSRLMRQFNEVIIHAVEEDAEAKLVRFSLVCAW